MNIVHIYYAHLDKWNIKKFQQFLPEDELNKISKIKHLVTFQLKILNRILLLYILESFFSLRRSEQKFCYNSRGKPLLKYHPDIRLNSSYSNKITIIALSRSLDIGIDIEFAKRIYDEDGIMSSFLSRDEYIEFKKYQNNQDAFFKFWTAKEAFVKALGKGIWEIDTLPSFFTKNNHLELKSPNQDYLKWKFVFFESIKEYLACLAVNSKTPSVRLREIVPTEVDKFFYPGSNKGECYEGIF